MKTLNQKIKLSGFFAILLALLAFSPLKTQAQCPEISNNLECYVNVLVEVGVYGINPNAPCLLSSASSIVVPPHTSVPVFCGGQGACNVRITLTVIGGYTVTPITIDFSGTTPVSLPTAGWATSDVPPCPVVDPNNTRFMYYDPLKNKFIFL